MRRVFMFLVGWMLGIVLAAAYATKCTPDRDEYEAEYYLNDSGENH